ncbi:hypothetical protein [Dysgonomonas sp. 511]|uniref:hypothetical protein n=1 Tax=Dysgonomonas sp. 511 TaxID=2302930 RepID=UPI0013D3AE90|nr:hypothetical protein [Dysgonomonas sp. 511]NDV79599.1 hypothetical protein [Dysgonomonas sp. 511]
MKKKICIAIILLFIAGFVFRAGLYYNIVEYKDMADRKSYVITNGKLTGHIEDFIAKENLTSPDADDIINLSLDITSGCLEFSTKHKDYEPYSVFENGGTNCIGYAAFNAAVANYLFKKYKLDDKWIAKPKKGQLYILGHNIHTYIENGWLKDHDFVAYRNKETGLEVYADPSVYDYIGTKRVKQY